VVGKRLFDHTPTGRLKFLFDVAARFFDGVGSWGSRTEINQSLHMRQRFIAGEVRPDSI
jgi:hypothetical protein